MRGKHEQSLVAARQGSGAGQRCETDQPDIDDSLEQRLQALVEVYSRERAILAEKVSQLEEANDFLTQRVQELEQASLTSQVDSAALPRQSAHPEHVLGLDFSLSEQHVKG